MKEIRSFLLSTFLLSFTLFSFTGCEDKKVQEPFIVIEDTTEIFTQKDKDQQKEKVEIEEVNETNQINETNATVPEPIKEEDTAVQEKKQSYLIRVPEPIKEEDTAVQIITGDTFTLSDIKQIKHKLTINNQKITFHTIDRSIVIVNFFSTWCSPCRGEIPYLSDLQKKYKKKIFIAGVLVNDEQDDHTLIQFMSKYHANYFISNSEQNDAFAAKVAKDLQLPENFPIPLTVIYKDGDYYMHYEGAVPVEMIDHDIQQIIKD